MLLEQISGLYRVAVTDGRIVDFEDLFEEFDRALRRRALSFGDLPLPIQAVGLHRRGDGEGGEQQHQRSGEAKGEAIAPQRLAKPIANGGWAGADRQPFEV